MGCYSNGALARDQKTRWKLTNEIPTEIKHFRKLNVQSWVLLLLMMFTTYLPILHQVKLKDKVLNIF